MHHIAILKKSLGLKEKVASGEKTVESRWYVQKRQPWDHIQAGDTVYFKNSGEPVTLAAKICDVLQCDNLTRQKTENIFRKYGTALGLSGRAKTEFIKSLRHKKYCVLIFLKNPKPVRPFDIDKKGFGAMAAWISVPDIRAIKKPTRKR